MTYAKKTLSEIKLIHGNYGNFIKGQKLDKKKEKKYKTPPYQDLAASNEIDGNPLDEKCWPGYEKKGMKTMFGKRYPNCVKKKKTRKEEFSDWRSELDQVDEGIGSALKAFSKLPAKQRLPLGFAGLFAAGATSRAIQKVKKYLDDKNIDLQVDKYVAARQIPGGPKKIDASPYNAPHHVDYMKTKSEATMTPAQKRKDTMLKKKYEKSDDMMKSFKDQYGKEKGKNVFYAFIRKKSMEEENIQEILDKKDVPHVKKLVGKLRKGSKTHAKQADDLEKAMKENTAIESELVIQDWNIDDIKFTEIETVDIIKAKPLLDEKFQFLKKAFGKAIILGKGADKMMGKSPRLSRKASIGLTTGKALKGFKDAIQKVKDMKKIDVPPKFPRDASRTITKTTDNIITIDPSKMGKKSRIIKKKNPPSLKDHYDWRDEIDEGVGAALKVGGMIAPKIPGALKSIGAGAATGLGIAGTMMKSKKKETSDEEDEDAIFKKAQDIIKDRNARAREYGEKPEVSQARERAEKKLKEFMAKRKKTRELTKNKKKLEKSYEKNVDNDIKDHYDWRTEIDEDWQKVNRKDKTDGLSKAAVKAYRRENPGSKLQTAVTKDPKKLKKGSKSAKRRLSFCRRMKGMKKKLTSAKTRRDPDSRINKALRRWNC